MNTTTQDNATGPSTGDPAAAEAVFLQAHLTLPAPLDVRPGDAVADIGPGAGAVTVAPARAVGDTGRSTRSTTTRPCSTR